MKVDKWNDISRSYIEREIPDDWNISMFEVNDKTEINCVNCGAKMKYRDGFTSKRYHNDLGLGYMECAKCYFDYMQLK